MINSNPSQNTLTKRESTNREFLSKASIIGLCTLYGGEFLIRIVNKTKRIKLTVENLSIEWTNLLSTPNDFDSNQFTRNEYKSFEANQFNLLGNYLCSLIGLEYQLTKSRETKKTVKMYKYKWIDPFNELGFKLFGEKIIHFVCSLPPSSVSKIHSFIHLHPFQSEILMIFNELISDRSNLTPNGIQMYHSLNTSIPQQFLFQYTFIPRMKVPSSISLLNEIISYPTETTSTTMTSGNDLIQKSIEKK